MKVVFMDRDGTLIIPPEDRRVDSPDKLKLFPDTIAALKVLADNDFSIVIITNQTGISEGRFTAEEYEQITAKLADMIAPSGIKILKTYTCPHRRVDECDCRKPKPKMLLDAAKAFDVQLAGSYMVGDRQDDIDIGNNAGTKTILVKTGDFPVAGDDATFVADTLLDAAQYIVAH
jgi:histidinol-phosphate phosphatase family protein